MGSPRHHGRASLGLHPQGDTAELELDVELLVPRASLGLHPQGDSAALERGHVVRQVRGGSDEVWVVHRCHCLPYLKK